METRSGKDSLIVSQPTDGVLTLEMVTTAVYKLASQLGMRTDKVDMRVIPTEQSGEIRYELHVEFKMVKDGTPGPPVDTTPVYNRSHIDCCGE